MKANKAPEKIYLQPSTIEELPNQNIVYTKPLADNSIEYTRTDAFVEKARKWFEEHADDYNYTWYNEMKGESGITIECIEDFINYMKGE